jgi:hypothetical protein
MTASGAVGFSRSLVVPLWNALRFTIYCYRSRRSIQRTDSISEETVEYEYEYRDAEYEYEKNAREENVGPNVLLATSLFPLAPWNPFLASLEIREWKETPSHARASFLGGIGFIGPNASFS